MCDTLECSYWRMTALTWERHPWGETRLATCDRPLKGAFIFLLFSLFFNCVCACTCAHVCVCVHMCMYVCVCVPHMQMYMRMTYGHVHMPWHVNGGQRHGGQRQLSETPVLSFHQSFQRLSSGHQSYTAYVLLSAEPTLCIPFGSW